MKFPILILCLLAITFSQDTVANECSSDEEQQKYVTNLVDTFRRYSKKSQLIEADMRSKLGKKADEYAKKGLITKEQAKNLFVNTLTDPVFNEFEKEKGIISSKFRVKIALVEVEWSKPKKACLLAKEAFSLFDEIHEINIQQYKLLGEILENKKI